MRVLTHVHGHAYMCVHMYINMFVYHCRIYVSVFIQGTTVMSCAHVDMWSCVSELVICLMCIYTCLYVYENYFVTKREASLAEVPWQPVSFNGEVIEHMNSVLTASQPTVASLPTWRTDYTCHHSHRPNEPRLLRLLWFYSHCPGHAGVCRNDRADRLASATDITLALLMTWGTVWPWAGLSTKVLIARRKEEWRRKRPTFHPAMSGTICVVNIGTVSRATLERLLSKRRCGARLGLSDRYDAIWSWAETKTGTMTTEHVPSCINLILLSRYGCFVCLLFSLCFVLPSTYTRPI